MFKIKDGTIHCSRGERGTILLKIPMVDANNYIKYEDNSKKIYWYNSKSRKLYDSDYNESEVSLETLTMVLYKFQKSDKVTFNIYERNGYDKTPIVTKDIIVDTTADFVEIPLLEQDTTFGNPVNKPTTFWYDIALNDYMTVVSYNEDGAKEFIEYPAKGDEE